VRMRSPPLLYNYRQVPNLRRAVRCEILQQFVPHTENNVFSKYLLKYLSEYKTKTLVH